MKKINKLYYVYNEDNKIEKLLVEYRDGTSYFWELPDKNRKLLDSQKEKMEKKMNQKLALFLSHFDNNSICIPMTFQQKEAILEIEEKIEQLKQKRYYHREAQELVLSILSTTFINLFTKNRMLAYVLRCFPISSSILAIKNNWIRKFDVKEECTPLVKELKITISTFLLAINLAATAFSLVSNSKELGGNYIYMVEDNDDSLIRNGEEEGSLPSDLPTTLEQKLEFWKMAIMNNHLLKNSEKEIAYSLEEYIKSDPYIYYNDIYTLFSTVYVQNRFLKNKSVLAQYFKKGNYILNYTSSSKEPETYQMAMYHEFVHMTGDLDNNFLNEGITSLICHEFYTGDYKDGYNRHAVMCKILCELIGSEKMLQAFSEQDIRIIENGLYQLYPNLEFNQNFLSSLNDYAKYVKTDDKEESVEKEKVIEIMNMVEVYLDSGRLSQDEKKLINTYYIVPFLVDGYDGNQKLYFHPIESGYQKKK